MTVAFKLRAPLPINIFNENTKKSEALIASMPQEIAEGIIPAAESCSEALMGRRDDDGIVSRPQDTPQAVFDNMHGMALAYFAHRLGDGLEMEVYHPDEIEDAGKDRRKKEDFVCNWIDHLERNYGQIMAEQMVQEAAKSVDAAIYNYFPNLKAQEPDIGAYVDPEKSASGNEQRRRSADLQRSLSRQKPEPWELN